MVSVTIASDLERGVPKSVSRINDIACSLFRGLKTRGGAEIVLKMFQRAHHGVGGEAAERAERAEFHGVAEVLDHRDVFRNALAAADLVDGLDAAGRTDPARRTLRAEFHRKARLLCHVDAVVEHDNAAMPDQAVACRKGLVIERRIEQRAGKVGAQGTADLYRVHGAPAQRAAADVIDQFAERDAEGGLERPPYRI